MEINMPFSTETSLFAFACNNDYSYVKDFVIFYFLSKYWNSNDCSMVRE